MEELAANLSFDWLHWTWLGVSLAIGTLLFLRPRPKVALLALIVMHGGAYLGYYGNLPRTYAVGVSLDRALGVGMAMRTAAGGSPFDHVQVQFGNLEPLWTFSVATLSGFSPQRVPWIYDHMTLLVLGLTALGFHVAWGRPLEGEDGESARWRGVLVAASVLGLSSIALAPKPPVQPFWQSNFVFKPNHALAFGLVGLLSRFEPPRRSWIQFGLIQGLLIWVFILDWAYLLPGFALIALLSADRWTEAKRLILAGVLAVSVSLPYIAHLARDYNPVGPGEMPQIWRDQMGQLLNHPSLWSFDLGPLLFLYLIGLWVMIRRGASEGPARGFLLSGPLVAGAYVCGLRFGFAPEPDEGFFYWRMVAAAGAGVAVWSGVRGSARNQGRRFALVFAAILAVSYPAYFNPSEDDRYFGPSTHPIDPPVQAAADWISAHTGPSAVLISSEGILLSGLAGRQFLMVRPDQTADRVERERAERDILTSLDEAAVRRAALRYGVTHVVIDGGLREKYGDAVRGLGNRAWFEPAFANSFARILVLRKAS